MSYRVQSACPAIAGLVSLRLVSGYERGNSKTEYVGLVALQTREHVVQPDDKQYIANLFYLQAEV